MDTRIRRLLFVVCLGVLAGAARAEGPGAVGEGNAAARQVAGQSALVRSAMRFLVGQAMQIRDPALRDATLDLLRNPATCVLHRRGLDSESAQAAVVRDLTDQGLLSSADAGAFAGGARAGIFPPIAQADSDCPQLPQPFDSAPGSVFDGHHSYPGGLAVHVANNDLADDHLWQQYRSVYGRVAADGSPRIAVDTGRTSGQRRAVDGAGFAVDRDVLLAAPIWHDWAKTIVFQWRADGSEFAEFNFGGTGSEDAWGAKGDSRTGAHHILSVAEAMARRLPALMVVTQASAHAAPTLGNEYKVVNWMRAAAVIARIDPVAAGYLARDGQGRLRLPWLGAGGAASDDATNLRVEYVLHNLSDADYTYSGPALASVVSALAVLAPEFGYDAKDVSTFNRRFRNPALSQLSAERLQIRYATEGIDGVRRALRQLRQRGAL